MLPTISLGPASIQFPPLLLLFGLVAAISLAEWHANQLGIATRHIDRLALIAALVGVLAARLLYVLGNLRAFAGAQASIFAINLTMFNLTGGLLAAALACLVYIRIQQVPLPPLLDALAPGAALFAVFHAFAQFASGDGFGSVVAGGRAQLPWAVYLWGQWRHPTQLYAMLAALLTLALLLLIIRFKRPALPPGGMAMVFAALAALSRLVIEAWRGDSVLWANGVREAQVYAWLVLAVALVALGRLLRSQGAPAGDPAISFPTFKE